jgi:hypothetical protein
MFNSEHSVFEHVISVIICGKKFIFQVLTAVCMKMTACWNIAKCSLLEVDQRLRGDDGGSKHLKRW